MTQTITVKDENKLLNHQERAAGLTVVQSMPLVAKIEVTTRCNLRCRMCSVSMTEKKREDLSMERFMKLQETFPYLLSAYLYGIGEPLLHPEIMDMFSVLSDYGVNVGVITNGMLLDEQKIEQFVMGGLYKLSLSIDAITPGTYEYIRRGASLERVLENMRMLHECKKRYGRTRPQVTFNAIIMNDTLEELVPLIHCAHEHGAEEVIMTDLLAFNDEMKKQKVLFDDPRLKRVYHDARQAAAECGIRLVLPHTYEAWETQHIIEGDIEAGGKGRGESGITRETVDLLESFTPCTEPWSGFWLTQEGDVTPCCYWFKKMGNIEQSSFRDVWNNTEYQSLRHIVNSAKRPQQCRHCPIP